MKIIYKCEICKKDYEKESECKNCERLCKDKQKVVIDMLLAIVKWNELCKQTPETYKTVDKDYVPPCEREYRFNTDELHKFPCFDNTKCCSDSADIMAKK